MRRLLPGVLMDSVALADAGWETVTISRGTVRTLTRVHRPSDSLANLEGSGVERSAQVIMRMVEAVTAR